MKAYVDEIESPAGPLAFAVNEDGALMRLHFVESDYGPVMEEDLEDEGLRCGGGRDQDRRRPKRVGRVCERTDRKTFDVPLAFAGSSGRRPFGWS